MNESPSFPLPKRDESKLLLYRDGKVSESVFKHITDYLPEGSLMVFNNTRVIQARLLFQRATGAQIEVFCLDPAAPHDYELIFQQTEACNWICLIGNAKKMERAGSFPGNYRRWPDGQTICRKSAELRRDASDTFQLGWRFQLCQSTGCRGRTSNTSVSSPENRRK